MSIGMMQKQQQQQRTLQSWSKLSCNGFMSLCSVIVMSAVRDIIKIVCQGNTTHTSAMVCARLFQ